MKSWKCRKRQFCCDSHTKPYHPGEKKSKFRWTRTRARERSRPHPRKPTRSVEMTFKWTDSKAFNEPTQSSIKKPERSLGEKSHETGPACFICSRWGPELPLCMEWKDLSLGKNTARLVEAPGKMSFWPNKGGLPWALVCWNSFSNYKKGLKINGVPV